jgi:UPF0755 protein
LNELPPNLPPASPIPVRGGRRLRGLAVLPFLLFALFLACMGATFLPGPLTESKTVIVPRGAGPHEVAAALDKSGAIYSPILFRFAVKVLAENALKAGEYQISAGQSLADIVQMMHEGRSISHLFTVAEGLTSAEIARLLASLPALGGDTGPMPPEGSLLPESYRYIYGDHRAGLIARMQKSMQETLNDLWAKRDPNAPLASPQEAVIMASIVEKETGKASERPRIAGVFYNRLRQHMRLQSDPTVIYGITRAKGFMDHDIGHEDLAFPSPYNTYMNDGLPPAPICNPGRAALEAALHPEANDFLYFVADGTGGHVFSRTLDEHNRNVTNWNQGKGKVP